eukprot:5159440-Amphidinium_carterae.1
MDESSVELIPTPRSAWTFGKDDDRAHPVPGDGKMSVTVSVALPLARVKQCLSSLKSFSKERQRTLCLQTTHLRTCVLTSVVLPATMGVPVDVAKHIWSHITSHAPCFCCARTFALLHPIPEGEKEELH